MNSSSSPYSWNGDSEVQVPRYSTLSLAVLPAYPAPGDLDISSLQGPGVDDGTSVQMFEFCLDPNKSSSWATLRLFSRVPATLQRPRYSGEDIVEGAVVLDLKRPQTIHSVVVSLRGRMITSSLSEGSHQFLEISHPVWCNTLDVSEPSAYYDAPPKGKVDTIDRQLCGRYEWPFSLKFPAEIKDTMTSTKGSSRDQGVKTYVTPQTVMERGVNANVVYEVIFRIVSGIMRTKHKITATVLYVPVIKPPPLPPLRAAAYRNGSYLVGPQDDPSGWTEISSLNFSVSARGTSHGLSTRLNCTAYIANPASYTRGTVIPCYLIYKDPDPNSTEDANALLHAFASQQCISLKLLQRVSYVQDPRKAMSMAIAETVKSGQGRKEEERSSSSKLGGEAVWWTPTSRETENGKSGSSFTTSMEGEIHIDTGLLPSSDVPFLLVSHHISVTLNPSQELDVRIDSHDSAHSAPQYNSGLGQSGKKRQGRVSASEHERELASYILKIVTAHSEAPIPAPFTPRPAKKRRDLSSVQDIQYHGSPYGRMNLRG